VAESLCKGGTTLPVCVGTPAIIIVNQVRMRQILLLWQYLKDLECPFRIEGNAEQSCEVVDWLLHRAVSLLYEDHGRFLSKDVKSLYDIM
jgi:hypothetical protein